MKLEVDDHFGEECEIDGTGPERIHTRIFTDAGDAASAVAKRIGKLIRRREEEGKTLVLGLASDPVLIPLFRELLKIHQEEGCSFRHLVIFHLNEYYSLAPDSLHSLSGFLKRTFLQYTDIPETSIHILRGDIPEEELFDHCSRYEELIEECGGIDIQLLTASRRGHLGFNEPGSPDTCRTRAVRLDRYTRIDAAEEFLGPDSVPRKALTMGIATIMSARQLILFAKGKEKAAMVKECLEGVVSRHMPPTILQHHTAAECYIDRDAASGLSRFHTPWLVGPCEWNDRLIRKAVVWLCMKVDKPVLKLTDSHYYDHGLGDLLAKKGPRNDLNIKVFNDLQHTITGWPGGKPGVEDVNRPERKSPYPKRCVVFSPHPDDDVISMGGTLARLAEQKHQVHVAYQTSGSVAVADEYIQKYLRFIGDYDGLFGLDDQRHRDIRSKILSSLESKKADAMDLPEVRRLKAFVRRGEAVAACRYFDIPEERIHFLDLPFYETGLVEKRPPGEEDIQIVMDLLDEVEPHQIFAAGDLADPHGTHKVCIEVLLEAVKRLKKRGRAWLEECRIWLYRGAWQEWEIEKVDMAVPISPDELAAKTKAILKHSSQKDGALFMGEDRREFWQRAQERNRATAQLYDKLGMAEYEAIEVFVRYHL